MKKVLTLITTLLIAFTSLQTVPTYAKESKVLEKKTTLEERTITLNDGWYDRQLVKKSFKLTYKLSIKSSGQYAIKSNFRDTITDERLDTSKHTKMSLYNSKGVLVRNSMQTYFSVVSSYEDIRHYLPKGDYTVVIESRNKNISKMNNIVDLSVSEAYDTPIGLKDIYFSTGNTIPLYETTLAHPVFNNQIYVQLEISVKRPKSSKYVILQKDSYNIYLRYMPKEVGKHYIRYRLWNNYGREETYTGVLNATKVNTPKNLKLDIYRRTQSTNKQKVLDIMVNSSNKEALVHLKYKKTTDKSYKTVYGYRKIGRTIVKEPKTKGTYYFYATFKQQGSKELRGIRKTVVIK